MGTKRNPGNFDCYEKAEPDEPIFTLLARDPLAPKLVRRWASFAERSGVEHDKVQEALDCADDMELFQREYAIRSERDRIAKQRAERDAANAPPSPGQADALAERREKKS